MKHILANEKNKGITLIALIVTIIVLIILAGVSISMLTGQNGTISKNTLKTSMKSYLGQDVELIGEGPWKYEGTDGVYVINGKF